MKSSNILLIDIGNTNLKWSLLREGRLSPVQARPHRGIAGDVLAAQCWSGHPVPDAIYLANVAGTELELGLMSWLQSNWSKTAQRVCPVAQAQGVINGYRDPSQLGVDRWLTLLAVHRQQTGAACIVDCGTAMTVDLLDGTGRHHGGLILPGLDLMRESLLQQTRIPRVSHVPVEDLFAHDTASAVASAAINSAAALIERSMRQAQALCDESPVLILTGSDAEPISKCLEIPFRIDQELVMKGLVSIAEATGESG